MTNRTPNNQPSTVAQAVALLLTQLKPEDKEEVRKMKKDDLIQLHFGLGMYIRNNFGLWQGNQDLLNDCGNVHEDDASGVIIEALWRALQSDPGPSSQDGTKSFSN